MSERSLKKLVYVLVSVALMLIVQACGRDLDPEESCSFVQNTKLQRVSWKGKTVKFYFHNSVPLEYHEAIRSAMKTWNEEVEAEVLTYEGIVGGPLKPNRDGYNIIYLVPNWEQNKKTEQARTTIYWSGDRIYEADVRINPMHSFSVLDTTETGKVDMLSLMVHEFGHVLGLAHVTPEIESVMHAHLASGKARREITDHDKSNVKCEYDL